MIQMHLTPSKETDNKLRWAAYVEEDQTEFKLYIPKWRVPTPWPAVIRVTVAEADSTPSPRNQEPPNDARTPIRARVRRVERMVHSVRFAPEGDPSSWQLGEPYIPHSLVPDPDAREVDVIVDWDLSSSSTF